MVCTVLNSPCINTNANCTENFSNGYYNCLIEPFSVYELYWLYNDGEKVQGFIHFRHSINELNAVDWVLVILIHWKLQTKAACSQTLGLQL